MIKERKFFKSSHMYLQQLHTHDLPTCYLVSLMSTNQETGSMKKKNTTVSTCHTMQKILGTIFKICMMTEKLE